VANGLREVLRRIKRAVVPPPGASAAATRARLFRFGFLCHAAADLPSGRHADWRMIDETWRTMAVGPFVLRVHPETLVALKGEGDRQTIILGHIFSAVPGAAADPLTRLAAAEHEDIPALLEGLSGRFALLTLRGGKVRFWHDPYASRTIYHRKGGAFGVASHDELLALAFGIRRRADMAEFVGSSWFGSLGMAHLPGSGSVHEGVDMLAANHYVDEAQRPVRYWPVRPWQKRSEEEFATAMDDWFAGLAAGLRARHPVVSITGGIDSRMVAAGLRHSGAPFGTVTWTSFNLQDWEREPVDAVVRYFNGRHDWVSESNDQLNDAGYLSVRNSGNYRTPSKMVAGMSRLYGDDPAAVFVRGHGSAQVRGGYPAVPDHYPPLTSTAPSQMARIYCREQRNFEPDRAVRVFVEREMERYAEVVNLDAVGGLGFDPNDLFYWEHKQTNWVGPGCNAVDPALDSLLGFNSRPLAEVSCGLPPEIRLTKTLFHDVIKRYDPGLGAIYYK
jgi:hypothetical protein